MSVLNVGDIVRIRKDLHYGWTYGDSINDEPIHSDYASRHVPCDGSNLRYAGRTVTVKNIFEDPYAFMIEESDVCIWFGVAMVECIVYGAGNDQNDVDERSLLELLC